ncbi:MAG TPA: CBS domain-containing protein [Longimicrobiales bacterium]|nr:CBS domain-containing protein [Longimicrobiales bacterium]
MGKRVRDIMLPLSAYAVVDEDATLVDALRMLQDAVAQLPPGVQPHRAVLVRDRRGEIVGKVHYFAFLRGLLPDRKSLNSARLLERAGVDDDMRDTSMRLLDLFTGDLLDLHARASTVRVRDVYTTTAGIREDATLADAIAAFLSSQTLSLLVRRDRQTVGILRLADLFDELSRQILGQERADPTPGGDT